MSTALVLSGGGPLAVAWECGLAAGRDPQALADAIGAETKGVPPPGATLHHPAGALEKLPQLFALAHGGDAGRAAVGAYALSADTPETEPDYLARLRLTVGIDAWPPVPELGLVVVDAADGRPRILRRDCGVALPVAVAASCCLPGLSPPVSIGGRRYLDGGLRSAANADLAVGFESVLVVCFHPPGAQGERMRSRLAAQSRVLTDAGARVCTITPDAASLDAIGPRTLDVTRRPAVARAALEQGAAAVSVIARFRTTAAPPASRPP